MTRARNSANLASHGNLFVDIANDRTGIGSVAPAQNLHVAGTAGFHADVTFTGDAYNTTWDRSENSLRFNDNAQIKLGTGNDANIRHDGNNTWIQNGTGYLYIDAAGSSSGIRLISHAHWQAGAMAAFYKDGGVQLFHDANYKFSTEAYGTNTVGTAVNDGLVVAGVATVTTMNVTGVLTYDDVTSVDSVGIVTARQGVRVTADGSDSSNYISVGAGGDLKLYHESNLSFIKNITGKLVLRSNTFQFGTADGTHRYIDIPDNEQGVHLYYDNTLRLSTGSSHVDQYGIFNSYGTGNGEIRIHPAANHVYTSVKFYTNAGATNASILCHAGSTLFLNTTSQIVSVVSGTEISELTSTGFNPRTSSTAATLGTSSKRWDNVYADAADIAGDLKITDSIVHAGDTNTKIRFPSNDTIQLETAGVNMVGISTRMAIRSHTGSTENRGQLSVRTSGTGDTIALAIGAHAAIPSTHASGSATTGVTTAIYVESSYAKRPEIRFHNSHSGNWHDSPGNTSHLRMVWTTFESSTTPEVVDIHPRVSGNAGGAFDGLRIRVTDNSNGLRNCLYLQHDNQYFFVNNTTMVQVSSDGLGINDSLYHRGDTNTKIRFPANDTISFTTSGSERVKIFSNGGTAISNAGSFPTSTNETLTVRGEGHNGHGTSNTRSVFNITAALTSRPANGGGGLWIGARTNEDTAVIGTRTANGNLAIETHNNGWGERLRITSTGNIGINQTNPTVKLQVTDTSAVHIRAEATANDGDALIQADGRDSSGNLRRIMMRTDAGADQYRIISSDTSYNLALCTGNAPRVLIAGNSAATSIGGSNTFNAMLTTQGDVSGGLLMLKATENTNRFFVSGNNTSGCEVNLYDEAGGQKGILGVSGTEFFIKAPNNSAPMTFYTHNGSSIGERLRIASDGKVTIGTSTPSSNSAAYMFTVADPTNSLGNCGITIRAGTGGGSNTNQGSIFFSNATSGINEYAGYLQYNHNDNWFRIGVGSAEKLRIDSSGTATFTGSLYIPDSIVHVGDTTCKIRFPSNDNIQFETAGSARLNITTGGSVYSSNFGIGTDDRWKIRPNNSNADLAFEYSTSSNLADSNIKMVLKSSGRVGINKNSPAEMLDVYGTIQCSGAGLKIDTHPIVSYASFTDISGGSYAARLGSTGSSTIRSTQIYGGGNHIATFDGVNYRLGVKTTKPQTTLDVRGCVSTGRNVARELGTIINISSSHNSSRSGHNVINGFKNYEGGSNRDWITQGGSRTNGNLTIDLGQTITCDRFVIYNQNEYSGSVREVKRFTLEGSNDNSSWTTVLDDEAGNSNAHEPNPGWSFRLPAGMADDDEGVGYRYWRFTMKTFHGSDSYGGVMELELYEQSQEVDDEVSTSGLSAGDISAQTIRSCGQPAFLATASQNNVDIGSGGTFPFNTEDYDRQGNFNTSNYTFYAPFTGFYFIYYQIYRNSSTSAEVAIYVNSNAVRRNRCNPNGGDFIFQQSTVLKLNKSDAVNLRSYNGSMDNFYGSGSNARESHFGGYFLG